jgi:hypothetical protein
MAFLMAVSSSGALAEQSGRRPLYVTDAPHVPLARAAPMIPQAVHTIRDPKVGTGT